MKNDTVYFRIETSSVENVVLNMSLKRTPYTIEFKKPVNITATPVSSWFKFYEWKGKEGETVLVTAKNSGKKGKNICAYLAIQDAKCPVASSKASIVSGYSRYMSFQSKGGMIASKKDFPEGIFIIILPMPSDEPCTGIPEDPDEIKSRKKTVELSVTPHNTVYENFFAFFITGVVITSAAVVNTLVFKRIFHRNIRYETLETSEEDPADGAVIRTVSGGFISGSPSTGTAHRREINSEEHEEEQVEGRLQREQDSLLVSRRPTSGEQELHPARVSSEGVNYGERLAPVLESELEGEEWPRELTEMTPNFNPLYVLWWKRVTEFKKKKRENHVQGSEFFYILIIMALFMALVALNIVKSNLYDFYSGSEDKCYFNTNCMSSFWVFPNFAPIFTNLPFIGCGISFFFITKFEQKRSIFRHQNLGVNKCYDVFEALAICLILQGILSSFHEICPNKITSLFDLMYAYIGAIILIIGVWGLRHGNVTDHVYPTVGFIGCVLLVGVLKEWIPNQIFWTIIIICHFVQTAIITTILCKFGTWSFSPVSNYKLWQEWSNLTEGYNIQNKHFTIIRTVIGIAVNITLMVVGPAYDLDINLYILLTCVVNVVLYILNYIVTKTFVNGETGTVSSWVYLMTAGIFWGLSLAFLVIQNIDVEATPSVSRSLNSDCLLFNAFSAHDIWHVTSAFALYFSFIGILILDNDLAEINCQFIPVF